MSSSNRNIYRFWWAKAVIYTDSADGYHDSWFNPLTIFGLNQLGGWSELQATIPVDFMSMWKPMEHKDFLRPIIFGAQYLEFGTGVLINLLSKEFYRQKTLLKQEEELSLAAF